LLAVEILVAVAVLVGVAFIASRPDIGGLDDEDTDHGDIGLPHGRSLRSDDIRHLRFRVVSGWRGTVRGYRFADVDAVMGKVEETLRSHEQSRNETR
jgi:DivIVA domain-containing protein